MVGSIVTAMLALLGLAYLLSSVAVAGPFEGECSLWNVSSIPVATSSTQYDFYDLTSSIVEAGIIYNYCCVFSIVLSFVCISGVSPSRVHRLLQGILQSTSEGAIPDGCITRMLRGWLLAYCSPFKPRSELAK